MPTNAAGRAGPPEAPSSVPSLVILVTLAALVPGPWLELQRGGAAWRILTCHLTHWTYEQLVWDGLAFAALAAACARRDRKAFHATLLASAVAVPLAVLAFAPGVASYRGLSGIDSALFALLLLRLPRRWPLALCAAGLGGKIAYETLAHHALFVQNLGAGVVPVPVAHLAGAIVGIAAGVLTSCGMTNFRLSGTHSERHSAFIDRSMS